jgi:hypothetical protein
MFSFWLYAFDEMGKGAKLAEVKKKLRRQTQIVVALTGRVPFPTRHSPNNARLHMLNTTIA